MHFIECIVFLYFCQENNKRSGMFFILKSGGDSFKNNNNHVTCVTQFHNLKYNSLTSVFIIEQPIVVNINTNRNCYNSSLKSCALILVFDRLNSAGPCQDRMQR